MAEIKLFSLSAGVNELPSTSVALEKELQTTIEKNMTTFFGVTFLKSEFTIPNGRIDSLGIDENHCPVVFEYKRSMSENVINQGLFYLDWLMDHKADYKLLVMEILGKEDAEKIDWSLPCVICIANDFTKYDLHAVNQMQRNIRLVKYKKFGNDLLLFEHLNAPNVKPIIEVATEATTDKNITQKSYKQKLNEADEQIKTLYFTIENYLLSLGDDVVINELKYWIAFKKIKNFVCVEVFKKKIGLQLSIDPKSVELQKDFIMDMTNIGHFGTGDLRIVIKNLSDFERIKYLINRAYEEG